MFSARLLQMYLRRQGAVASERAIPPKDRSRVCSCFSPYFPGGSDAAAGIFLIGLT